MCKKTKRPNGRGTLFKRGKTFYAVWMRNGQRFQVSTHKTTRPEAEAVLAELTADFAPDNEVKILETVKAKLETARRGRLPLGEALNAFLEDRTKEPLAETTLYAHRRRFRALVEWMAKNRPEVEFAEDITLADARAFIKAATEGKTNKTFNDYRALLMQIWDTLIKRNAADTNPWKLIDRRERLSVTRRELDAEGLARLVAAADGEMRLLFLIGIYTGLRLKDAALLQWRQVDLRRGFIQATPAKTARHGTTVLIPIVEPLRNALAAAMGADAAIDGEAFVCPDLAIRYNRFPKGVSIAVQRTFRKAGFDTAEDTGKATRACVYGFHSFRHTFVSMAFAYGIPMPIVQAIVGHTNAAMTRHYLHIAPEELARAMEKFKAITALTPAGLIADGAQAAQNGAEAAQGAQGKAGRTLPRSRAFKAFVDAFSRLPAAERAAAVEYIGKAMAI